jgi:DnaJ-class molecular chaperone
MTPYEILEVAKDASDDEIKKAYRKLAMKWHPDRNAGNEDQAKEEFQKVKEAFEQIENAEKRAEYEAGLHPHFGWTGSPKRNPYRANESFDDIFADLFKDFNMHPPKNGEYRNFDDVAHAARARHQPPKNEDAEIKIEITLEEAFSGKEAAVTYKTPDGEVRQVLLNIPAGIIDGKVVRCKTAGSRKQVTLPPGDLLATIKIKPHVKYIREAQNVVMKVEVPALDMLAGGSTRITTIDGTEFDINVRSCTKPGTRIRIPEYGMRVMGSRLRGDMFIELNVLWPDNLAEEVLEHLKTARDLTLPKTV